jgi:HK97 family phage major capsid protein
MQDRETKQADPGLQTPDVIGAFDEFMGAFEAFKSANDERLAQIEHRLSADVVTSEKVARINDTLDSQKRAMDEMLLRQRRPELGAPSGEMRGLRGREHKAAFERYVRKGETGSSASRARRCRRAPIPMAAFWCPPRPRR